VAVAHGQLTSSLHQRAIGEAAQRQRSSSGTGALQHGDAHALTGWLLLQQNDQAADAEQRLQQRVGQHNWSGCVCSFQRSK
jgi:hypothetical protein